VSDPPRAPEFKKRLSFAHLLEGVRLALDTLVEHRMRSALVILGVSIAVATSMGMVAILSGLGKKITDDVKGGDAPIFSLTRFSHIEKGDPDDLRHRPKLTALDAETIAELPEVGDVEVRYGQGHGRALEHGDQQARLVFVMGTNLAFEHFQTVNLEYGRFFTDGEVRASAPVCVLAQATATDVFPGGDAIGKSVRVNGQEFEVVGVFARYDSLFGGLFENFAIVPWTTYERRLKDDFESLMVNVFPRTPGELEDAVGSVRGVMRARHHLRPSDPDDFSIVTSDAALEFTQKITGPIALVLVVIASIGLMVGGIGVLIIMLVSVTERTREIGVRKAIGASRREILWQFLTEAGVLTTIGGAIGVLLGLAIAQGASSAMHFPFVLPVQWIVVAVAISAGIGLVFGLYPANRAARLDPIESLRYE
jgi:putative ABC transport system permease protein